MSKEQALRLAREWQKIARRWAKCAREYFRPSAIIIENVPFELLVTELPFNPKRFAIARDEALNARDNAAHYFRLAKLGGKENL